MARREHASAAELAGGLSLSALDALRVATRSAANRAALLHLDALPALTGLLKARHPHTHRICWPPLTPAPACGSRGACIESCCIA